MNTFELIYQKYKNSVYRICLRYMLNKEEANEMVLEVFLKINQNIDSFEYKSDWFTLIYKITINACLEINQYEPVRCKILDGKKDQITRLNFQESSEESFTKITLEKILTNVSFEERDLMVIILGEGVSRRDAGKIFGISHTAVSKRMDKFIKKVRKEKVKAFESVYYVIASIFNPSK